MNVDAIEKALTYLGLARRIEMPVTGTSIDGPDYVMMDGPWKEYAQAARAELAAVTERNTALEAENAAMHEAITQHLEWGPKTGSDRDLLDADLKAALTTPPTGMVLVEREKLQHLQWQAGGCIRDPGASPKDYIAGFCPVCGRNNQDGHAGDCWLAALLETNGKS